MSALESLHVLLVDDNPHMRCIVMAILKGVGVKHVREVSHGGEALHAMRDFAADLAIVDFNMSPLDGVEFTKLVRNAKDSPNAYLPIIMMTGHAERSRVVEARNAGVNEFVVKPVTARSILSRIQAVIFKPRPYVRTEDYFGPCRRRVSVDGYTGPFRRGDDGQREAVSVAPAAASNAA